MCFAVECAASAGLGEFRIRDLNNHINKLLREKQHWQDRNKELGGADYFVSFNVHQNRKLHSFIILLPMWFVVECAASAGLGEFHIRDLNDHINKLLREKQHW